jgi:bifunctional DNA-binding transcriptional regulator/antitoxin component of YhaV-PrlF toxin-antitoxin module
MYDDNHRYPLGERCVSFDMTITARGQFTLNKSSMQHLGIRPGEKVSVSMEPGGAIRLVPAKNKLTTKQMLERFRIRSIGNEVHSPMTISEMNEAIAQGYENAGKKGLK